MGFRILQLLAFLAIAFILYRLWQIFFAKTSTDDTFVDEDEMKNLNTSDEDKSQEDDNKTSASEDLNSSTNEQKEEPKTKSDSEDKN